MFKPHRPNPYLRLLSNYTTAFILRSLFTKKIFFFGGETNRVKERPVIGRKSGGVEIADHTASVRRRRSVFEFSYRERETDTQK